MADLHEELTDVVVGREKALSSDAYYSIRHMYKFKYAFAQGNFGKIWRVVNKQLEDDPTPEFAIKELSKKMICKDADSDLTVHNELKLMSTIKSNFVLKAHKTFQDSETLFLVMELAIGGTLAHQLE